MANTLANIVRTSFQEAKTARGHVEQRWAENLRQYRGEYGEDTVIHPSRSHLFVRETYIKVQSVVARMNEILFPSSGEKNWSITPTPNPELDPQTLQALTEAMVNQAMIQAQQTGQLPQPIGAKDVEEAVRQVVEQRCESMVAAIDDQLTEGRYRAAIKEVILSGTLYGTGVLKGPLVERRQEDTWAFEVSDINPSWNMQSVQIFRPFFEAVRLRDVYPDPSCTRVDDCRYLVQRYTMTRQAMIALAKREDFDSQTIREYLTANPDGDTTGTSEPFEQEIAAMGGMETNPGAKKGRYEVLEFWGWISSEQAESAGLTTINNPLDDGASDLFVNVWVVGENIIKANESPVVGIKFPYFFFYHSKDDSSIWGEGIPSIMESAQKGMNAATRIMVDNVAISGGPQYEVNRDLLLAGQDPMDIHPHKVWLRSGNDADFPAIRVLQLPSHSAEFMEIANFFKTMGDSVTSPSYAHGEADKGAGNTASGLSMLMGASAILMKSLIGQFDEEITGPFIRALYHWNMMFNPDNDIKGDFEINAQGASSLMAKEWRGQQLMQFLTIATNPVITPLVSMPTIVRGIVSALDLPKDVIKSDEDIQAQEEAQRQMMAKQQAMAELQLAGQQRQVLAEQQRTVAETTAAHAQTAKTIMEAANAGQPPQQVSGGGYPGPAVSQHAGMGGNP